MIKKLRIYQHFGFDPYTNLAIEKRLMDTTESDVCTLYLWQNQNTVVIGKNQNPWTECRTTLLSEEGGKLARRLSGGGAVFHDVGNLNFTFLMAKENYDLPKQLSVIQAACAAAGITAEPSGRNDLLADGRKFSGNAFYQNRTHAYHHGTLLIDVDMSRLQRYLSPPKAKLEAKGVSSVRSRVVNLNQLSSGLTCDRMRQLMAEAFQQVYGFTAAAVQLTESDMEAVETLRSEYADWEYLFGTPLPFTFSCENRFDWGHLQLQLDAKNGIIHAVKAFSDSMDWLLAEQLEHALTGCRFRLQDMQAAIRNSIANDSVAKDLCCFLQEQSL